MTLLGMIRHGRTAWNGEGRLTGRADISLTDQGRAALVGLRPPKELDGAHWHVSPLRRTQQTARIIGGRAIEFRTEDDPVKNMAANEDRGLDFLPPDGESPRMVQIRLRPFIAELGRGGGRHVAVAHKSVIRAIFAEAYDWDMMGRPPVKLRWDQAHLFSVDCQGNLSPVRMNVPMQVVGETYS